MSGSANAGTIAERHTCELRVLTGPNSARSSEARLRRIFFSLTKDLHGGRGRVAPSLVATDSSSTRESCILGIVIELLRMNRGGWVALLPGNCSTYGFVDIH